MLMFVLLVLMSAVNAQVSFTTEEQLLAPESSLMLKDGDYTRYLSGAELKREMKHYQVEKENANGAYEEQVAAGKTNLVIPVAPETVQAMERQEELFQQAAVTFEGADISESRGDAEFKIGYNQQWGKKETFAAYIDALLKIYGSQAYRSLDAHCYAGGYVFNYHARALEFNMAMRSGDNPSAHTELKIFGKSKFSYSGTTVYKKVYFQDEVGKTVRFFIGPVPVSVKGSIGGSAGFDAGVTVFGTGIQGSLTPAITSYGKADAGVDLWFVKAGVEGSLVLVNDNLPATVTAQLVDNAKALELALKVVNNLKALSGNVVVFVKVKEFWKFWKDSWKKYSMTLFSWNGYQKSWVLIDKSTKINF
jgi:hypothetical protein